MLTLMMMGTDLLNDTVGLIQTITYNNFNNCTKTLKELTNSLSLLKIIMATEKYMLNIYKMLLVFSFVYFIYLIIYFLFIVFLFISFVLFFMCSYVDIPP